MGGLRVALEQIKALTEIPFAHKAGDHELIYQIATEALAQQPAADCVPIPTSEDQAALMTLVGHKWLSENAPHRLKSKQPAAGEELTDEEIIAEYELEMQQHLLGHEKANVIRVCRKAIAAHEAKKNGGGV